MIEFSSEKYEFDILVIDNKSEDLSVDFVKEWYPEIRVAELSKTMGLLMDIIKVSKMSILIM